MRNMLLLSILFSSVLLADSSLEEEISVSVEKLLKDIIEETIPSKKITNTETNLTKNLPSSNLKKRFRRDHHRYDKRYAHFDYEHQGYYNDDGYYYGYYDRDGYFYNNIYFTYNNLYTYEERSHRRGRFASRYHHHRRYRYHRRNDWNRVHCYYEPNAMVRGHYYTSYPSNYYGSDENHYRHPPRINVTRMNGQNSLNHNDYGHRNSYCNHSHRGVNVTRMQNNPRSYAHPNRYRRSTTRMSPPRGSSQRHMGVPR